MTQTTGAIPEWKDATSYSQGQRGKADPTAWRIDVNGFLIFITKRHVTNPYSWTLTCRDIGADVAAICPSDTDADDAKALALKYVAVRLIEKSDRLRSVDAAIQVIMKGHTQ